MPSDAEIKAIHDEGSSLGISLSEDLWRQLLSAAEKEREGDADVGAFDEACQAIGFLIADAGASFEPLERVQAYVEYLRRAREGETRGSFVGLTALLRDIELHDATGDPRDEGFMDCWSAVAEWCEAAEAHQAREGDIIEKLREWEMHQREAWEGAHASGAEGAKVGTALGVLDRLRHFLNDLQEQSTGGEG